MRKQERHAYVLRRARELAESGKFGSWHEIEFELRFTEGYGEARGWLDDQFLRKQLDEICSRHVKATPADA